MSEIVGLNTAARGASVHRWFDLAGVDVMPAGQWQSVCGCARAMLCTIETREDALRGRRRCIVCFPPGPWAAEAA